MGNLGRSKVRTDKNIHSIVRMPKARNLDAVKPGRTAKTHNDVGTNHFRQLAIFLPLLFVMSFFLFPGHRFSGIAAGCRRG